MDPNCVWNVAPMDPRGDLSPEALYRSVGWSLTQWEKMEFNCAELYGALLSNRNHGAVQGYGLIAAFGGRHELLLAAYRGFPYQDRQPFSDIQRVLREVDGLSSRRNEIAHGVVSDVTIWGVKRFYLLPSGYSTNKQSLKNHALGKYVYTSRQIEEYGRNFMRLGEEARAMMLLVRRAWPELRREEESGIPSELFPETR